ncbi:MAG TPA: hypothetical protein VFO52_10175 [Longimicrobiales bacterium]|nr:hypothetical protein [Longimicrobiales bacterium]
MKTVSRYLMLLLVAAGCGAQRTQNAPPVPAATPAPVLAGMTVMVFPVQYGSVPVAQAGVQHFAIERPKLDAEIAYWLQQNAGNVRWILPETIQRTITRSPALNVDITNLAVTAFQHAQVRRIGDPLFGDLRKLAAVLDGRLALIPVAAELIGATPDQARVQVAVAVIDALDGNVLWFGILESDADARGAEAGIASAAQAMSTAFGGKKN